MIEKEDPKNEVKSLYEAATKEMRNKHPSLLWEDFYDRKPSWAD